MDKSLISGLESIKISILWIDEKFVFLCVSVWVQ